MNAQGTPVVDVALYYPIEDLQRETYAKGITPVGRAIDMAFNAALNCLIENQIDTDIVDCESLMRAEIADGRLAVGKEQIAVLLIPDAVKLDGAIAEKLNAFTLAGGKVLYYSTGAECGINAVAPETIHLSVADAIQPDVSVTFGDRSELYVNHRKSKARNFISLQTARRERERLRFCSVRGEMP